MRLIHSLADNETNRFCKDASVVRVRADHLKDVTIGYITKSWEDEQHQPFGLGEEDLVGFVVERMWENNDA